jgi:large subunit ribosomal protein L6
VTINGQNIAVKGPRGELNMILVNGIKIAQGLDSIGVTLCEDTQHARAMWGLSRTMISNIIAGVTMGFTKKLEITGIGYRAAIQGENLQLNLGFSHEVLYPIPKDIDIKVSKPTEIVISGINKQKVGQVAAEIRRYRAPEPYQGKGIRYADEFIFRKEGKKK